MGAPRWASGVPLGRFSCDLYGCEGLSHGGCRVIPFSGVEAKFVPTGMFGCLAGANLQSRPRKAGRKKDQIHITTSGRKLICEPQALDKNYYYDTVRKY